MVCKIFVSPQSGKPVHEVSKSRVKVSGAMFEIFDGFGDTDYTFKINLHVASRKADQLNQFMSLR